jgi:hypothetical protein
MPPKPKSPTPLFDDLDLSSGQEQVSRSLRFAGGGEALSKEEKAFNRLTARIKSLQARIETAERENLELDQYYLGQFRPALQALGEAMMALAMRLQDTASRQRPGKVVGRLLKRVIPALLQEAFQFAEPTPEAMVLHDTHSRRSYQTLQDEEEAEAGEAVLNFFEEMGFEVPLDIRKNLNDEEAMDAFAEQLARQVAEELGAGAARPPRKKTRKQLEREARERQKDELKQRSLRDVYIALAKVLHPDAESDPGKKHEKEAFLKRVTAAYREGNLMELLHLEMEWLEGGGVRNASADKLTLYIELLKDQVRDLEATCSSAENKFRETYSFFPGSIGAFRRALAKELAEAEIEKNRLVRLAARLEAEPDFLEDCLAVLREDFP